MRKDTPADYDKFYEEGGWKYDSESEYLFLIYRILQPPRIPAGGKLLELGCGTGLHAALFRHLGFEVTAVDISEIAIQKATAKYKDTNFVCMDARSFLSETDPETFDVVFIRGLSWFHYELGPGKNRFGVNVQNETDSIMKVLRPNGFLVIQMRTDFSGTACTDTGVHNHTWYSIMELLEPRGEIRLFTDWNGLPLTNAELSRKSGANALCILRKT